MRSPEAGLWSDDEGWTVSEELKIGGDLGETRTEYMFGFITSMAVDETGSMYIADQQAQEVRRYDSDGQHVMTFGQAGSGPGELGQVISGLGVFSDQLVVSDLANQRFTTFALDGSDVGGSRYDVTTGLPIRFDGSRDRPLVLQRRLVALTGEDTGELPGDVVVAVDRNGELGDTVLSLPAGQSFSIEGGRAQIRFFEPEPIWDLGLDGRFVSGMNSSYRIEVRDASGSMLHVIERPFETRPVLESDKEVVLDMIRSTAEEQGMPPQFVEQFLGQYSFADNYPAFAAVVAGPFSSVWVQRVLTPSDLPPEEVSTESLQNLGSPDWDVFDENGYYLGVVTMPGGFQPLVFDGDSIFGIFVDELGVQSAVRLRLNRETDET